MKKYINIIFGALIFLVLILILSDISKNQSKPAPNAPEERYFISSKEKPSIREAILKPLDFVPNEEQVVYVKAENENPVEKVTAEVSTDKKISKFELKLFEGNEKIGTWRGSWRINDTHNHTYTTTITALSGNDKSSVDLSFPLGTKRQVEEPKTDSTTLIKVIALVFIVIIFILVKTGLIGKIFRKVFIFLITIALTVGFIPGIFNLKPQKAYAAIPSGVIVAWPSTNASIPSGWTRVTALDGRFPKQIATSSTAPGATGGAASHNHSYASHSDHSLAHSHTWGSTANFDTGPANEVDSGSGITVTPGHSHPTNDGGASGSIGAGGPANYDSTTTEPPHFVVIFIKSDGTPSGIPASAVAWFNAAAPTGWTAYANGVNRLWKGAAAAGDGGATGGTGDAHSHTSAAHSHTVNAHTHSLSFGTASTVFNAASGSYSGLASGGHSHGGVTSGSGGATTSGSSSEGSGNGDMTPPWVKSLVIENTSGAASIPTNTIAMWDGTLASIPAGWKLCDGTNCTANLSQGKFVRGATSSGENGTTGGAATHTHPGAGHTHTGGGGTHSHTAPESGVGSGSVAGIQGAGVHYISEAHTHGAGTGGASVADPALGSRTTSAGANASNDPVFTGVAYIQFQNSNPNAPTIMGSSPIPGSKPNKNATTITLQGTATDPDASDTVQIDWDYSSNSGGGWTNIGTTSLGAQNTTLSLTWTISGLTAASTYRLRARTIDNGAATSSYTTQTADWTLTSGCSPPVSGSLTIAASCAFPETVDGVDAGNITINSAVTLTINSGQTVAFNSGQTISPNGDIARTATGQIKKTNLWMVDSDADGWPATAVQSAQDSTPGGTYRRRNLLNSDRIIDCNDAVLSSTNSC